MTKVILESKLKRHKISCSSNNGKLTIGKPTTDYGVIIGLIAFPILAAIAISLFLILKKHEFIDVNLGKMIVGIISLFFVGFFNLSRIIMKKRANNNLKILQYKTIRIENELGKHNFDSKNTIGFEYFTKQIDEETYQGKLYLVDSENKQYQILGFDDDDEKYLLNDLKWFSEYLNNYIELKEASIF